MKWFLKWRLRRAEKMLMSARIHLAACESANERYEGACSAELFDAVQTERRLEALVAELCGRLDIPTKALDEKP